MKTKRILRNLSRIFLREVFRNYKKYVSLFLLVVLFANIITNYGCNKDEAPTGTTQINYNVKYENGVVTVPSSYTICYNGQNFNGGSAQVPTNTLIGIVKDTVAFLYNTAMGNTNLSKETSRRAIGYVFFNIDSSLNTDVTELSTGIKIEQIGNKYRFTNTKQRFSAIKNGNTIKYLAPRGELINLDWYPQLSCGNLISVINDNNFTMSVNGNMETYGASIRLLTIQGLPGLITRYIIEQKNRDAISAGADATILARVNSIDLIDACCKSIAFIIGAVPLPCWDCIGMVICVLLDAGTIIINDYLTKSDATTLSNWNGFISNIFNNYKSCLISCSIEWIPKILVIKEIFDAIIESIWYIDNVLLSYYDISTTTTFATWNPSVLQPPTLLAPANGSTIQSLTPILDWSDVSGVISYTVQASTNSGFTSFSVNQSNVTASQYNIPSGVLLQSTTYYWRVNATNGSSTSSWSSVWNFTTTTNSGGIWSPIGGGVGGAINPFVYGLTVYNNELIACGGFTIAGGITSNHIAKWNGSTWLPLGSGFNYGASVLTNYNGSLIAGGIFTTAGGINANSIAKWDGGSWSPLGGGLNGGVYALTVYNGNLIAGGYFNTAGGIHVNNIAKWNGGSWDSIGGGVNSIVGSLITYNGKLIAGGDFTTAGGTSVNYIAQWDGNSWSSLGSGMNSLSDVWALTVYGGNLIAGGTFTTAGGISANYIAKWNGNSWSSLGSGLNYYVSALTVFNNNLIAGGHFTVAGGGSALYIAKWNGNSWSPLGSGMGLFVESLTNYGGYLIAGGKFNSAGGFSASYIAQWYESK